MAPTASEYVITETTKFLGQALEHLADLRADIEGINTESLADIEESTLTMLHESFQKLNTGLVQYRLVTLVASTITNRATEAK